MANENARAPVALIALQGDWRTTAVFAGGDLQAERLFRRKVNGKNMREFLYQERARYRKETLGIAVECRKIVRTTRREGTKHQRGHPHAAKTHCKHAHTPSLCLHLRSLACPGSLLWPADGSLAPAPCGIAAEPVTKLPRSLWVTLVHQKKIVPYNGQLM